MIHTDISASILTFLSNINGKTTRTGKIHNNMIFIYIVDDEVKLHTDSIENNVRRSNNTSIAAYTTLFSETMFTRI